LESKIFREKSFEFCRVRNWELTSTKLATFPSSSIPLVLNLVPALFQLNLLTKAIVDSEEVEVVEGEDEGTGRVKTPTYP